LVSQQSDTLARKAVTVFARRTVRNVSSANEKAKLISDKWILDEGVNLREMLGGAAYAAENRIQMEIRLRSLKNGLISIRARGKSAESDNSENGE
jgi:hypothetical protein